MGTVLSLGSYFVTNGDDSADRQIHIHIDVESMLYDPHTGKQGMRRYLPLEDAIYKLHCLAQSNKHCDLSFGLVNWHPDTVQYFNQTGLSENIIWGGFGQVGLYGTQSGHTTGLLVTSAPTQYRHPGQVLSPPHFVRAVEEWGKHRNAASFAIAKAWDLQHFIDSCGKTKTPAAH